MYTVPNIPVFSAALIGFNEWKLILKDTPEPDPATFEY